MLKRLILSCIAKYRGKRDMPVSESYGSLLHPGHVWLVDNKHTQAIIDDDSRERHTEAWKAWELFNQEVDAISGIPDSLMGKD